MTTPIFTNTNTYSIYDKNSSIFTQENNIARQQDFIVNFEHHYLSMAVFDDGNECYSHCTKYHNYDDLRKSVCEYLGILLNDSNLYFDMSVTYLLGQLLEYDHCVFNRHQKYYVIAFAINFEPFQIWSKDCEARIIKWNPIDEQSKEIIDYKLNNNVINPPPEDYNLNPVIKCMENLNVR